VVGSILANLERFAEADAQLARACENLAFHGGEHSGLYGECVQQRVIALSGLGKNTDALALAEQLVPIMVAVYGEDHVQAANAHVARGTLHAALGHRALAIADLEAAVAAFSRDANTLDRGHLAAAEIALADAICPDDRTRARALAKASLAHFEHASAQWARTRAEANRWLASH
jgi:hypothetical protein